MNHLKPHKMKKVLFLILAVSVASISAWSQTSLTSAAYPANTLDTVTNAASKQLVSGALYKAQDVVIVQFLAEKISGTVGGTATLQGSVDGVSWYNIGSAFTLTDVATQTTHFKVTDAGEVYFRVQVTGTGTMSVKISGKYVARSK